MHLVGAVEMGQHDSVGKAQAVPPRAHLAPGVGRPLRRGDPVAPAELDAHRPRGDHRHELGMGETVQDVPVVEVLVGMPEVAGAKPVVGDLRPPIVEVAGDDHRGQARLQRADPNRRVAAVREPVVADPPGVDHGERLQKIDHPPRLRRRHGHPHHPHRARPAHQRVDLLGRALHEIG